MKPALTPFKFDPILIEKIWGGKKLFTVLGKGPNPGTRIGESWEISGLSANPSVVSEGQRKGRTLPQLIKEFKGDLVGNRIYSKYKDKFPLLFKFIDAEDKLSIQVHPREEQANPKTEMWFIIQADKGASLISGFSKKISPVEFEKYFLEGRIEEILNKDQVEKYDAFFLPSGRIHTIGKGLLLAEIQQSSDTTYRIYDYDRKDEKGNKRALHIKAAKGSLKYSEVGSNKKNVEPSPGVSELIYCPHFNTRLWKVMANSPQEIKNPRDSFTVLMGIEGSGWINCHGARMPLKAGETILIPAIFNQVGMESDNELVVIEIWMP